MKNALQLPKSYSTHDRLWNIFVERNVSFPSQKMWGWYSMNLKNMGDLLYSENKYEQALTYYISTFVIDLSGIQEHNYIQELEYVSISHSLIKNIKNLIDLAEIDLDRIKSMIDSDMASKCLPFQYYTKDTIYKILLDCLNGIEFNPNKYPHNFPSTNSKQYEYYGFPPLNKDDDNTTQKKVVPYQIIDRNTVKFSNEKYTKTYTKKEIRKIRNRCLFLAIFCFLTSYYLWFFFFISLFFIYSSYTYHKIIKVLNK